MDFPRMIFHSSLGNKTDLGYFWEKVNSSEELELKISEGWVIHPDEILKKNTMISGSLKQCMELSLTPVVEKTEIAEKKDASVFSEVKNDEPKEPETVIKKRGRPRREI